MATEAQIIANRRNAQKSTSPRTLSMSLGATGDLFMQNKANLLDAQMNISSVLTKYYENVPLRRRGENKPKQTQFQTKCTDLPQEVTYSVFDRMMAERQRIAKKYRSEGEEEAVKVRAQTDKDKTILLADSYMEAEKTKGEGDAEALRIYAEAYEKDPEFYSFVRTLEAYEKSLGEGTGTTIVLPFDSEFFQYFSPPKKE